MTDRQDVACMAPVSLEALENAGVARTNGPSVVFRVSSDWCAPGERRLGYAGIVRLIECVRELHWRHDVAGRHPAIDSITKSLAVDFSRPVSAGASVRGEYSVRSMRSRAYVLDVSLLDEETGVTLAAASLDFVFYDEHAQSVVDPPAALAEHLAGIANTG